jgi:hypothetical protein
VSRREWAFWAVGAVLLVTISAVVGGRAGLMGAGLGLVATLLNNWGLWGAVKLMGASAPAEGAVRAGTVLTVTAFLLKLPVFLLLGMMTLRIGGAAPACFLLGLALVYSATIRWAVERNRDDPRPGI